METTAPPKRHPGAFTMVELLVVIAIIVVLAALAFGVFGRVHAAAKRTTCMGNMREIGAALGLYRGENNMELPHCWVSTPCNPRTADPDEFGPFSGHLAKYLGHDDVSRNTKVFLPQFQCPSYPVQLSRREALEAGWHNTYRLVLGKLGQKNPFGGRADAKPLKPLQLEEVTGLSSATLPVVYDMDQELDLHHGPAPETPVHGAGRNVLYLDGHVGFETDPEFVENFR